MSNPEEWRPVVSYEGFYEVSSLGRVRSLDRQVRNSTSSFRLHRGQVLAQPLNPGGYRQVILCINNRRSTQMVHVLVARAFCPGREPGFEVLHADDQKLNNAASNLRWGTRSENLLDRVRNGIHHNSIKTRCKQGHEFTPSNTFIKKGNGARGCRECKRSNGRANYAARRNVT